MNINQLSNKQHKACASQRRSKAVVGSDWIFFRDGDPEMKHPWSALKIRIIKVIQPGKLFLCKNLQPHFLPRTGRNYKGLLRVKYSELW